MKRIRVPEGMYKAARIGSENEPYGLTGALEAALLWLYEHPQVPTDEQLQEIEFSQQPFIYDYARDPSPGLNFKPWTREKHFIREWQRRCFVQEEPEIPEEIRDLLWDKESEIEYSSRVADMETHNEDIVEAYRRGLTRGSVALRKGEQK